MPQQESTFPEFLKPVPLNMGGSTVWPHQAFWVLQRGFQTQPVWPTGWLEFSYPSQFPHQKTTSHVGVTKDWRQTCAAQGKHSHPNQLHLIYINIKNEHKGIIAQNNKATKSFHLSIPITSIPDNIALYSVRKEMSSTEAEVQLTGKYADKRIKSSYNSRSC